MKARSTFGKGDGSWLALEPRHRGRLLAVRWFRWQYAMTLGSGLLRGIWGRDMGFLKKAQVISTQRHFVF